MTSKSVTLHPIQCEQLRNIGKHHASTLRMVRTDLREGRVDDIVFNRLEAAIEMFDLLAIFGKKEAEE